MEYVRKMKTYILAALSAGAVMLYEGIRVTNVLSFPLVFCVFILLNRSPRLNEKRDRIIAYIVAMIIDMFIFLRGTQVLHEYDMNGLEKAFALIVMLTGFFIIVERTLEIVYLYADRVIVLCNEGDKATLRLGVSFAIILACWTPFYLWSFPGIVTSDSTTQILQALNRTYSNHHPVIQTWLILAVWRVTSSFTESLNVLVACCTILQSFFMAFTFAYVVYILGKNKVRKSICILILLYFAITPYNIMMSINMWKDTLFSAGFLLFLVGIWQLTKEKNAQNILLIIVGGVILCMFRNNGWYSFVASLPFIIIRFWKKRKDICAAVIVVLAVAIGFRGPVFKAFNVAEPNVVESLAIPMQQIANVISNGKELTDEEISAISEVIEIEKIPKTYDAQCADYIKNLILIKGNTDAIVRNKSLYFLTWLKIGIRNPGLYLEAFVGQTEGYYNPDIQRWQYTQGVWDTQMPIENIPLLPNSICQALKWYVSDWLYRIPILGMIKSIGFFVWLMFSMLGLCILKRKYENAVLFVPLIAYWGTVIIATPVYAEFRYIYCLFTAMPVLLILSLEPREIEAPILQKVSN